MKIPKKQQNIIAAVIALAVLIGGAPVGLSTTSGLNQFNIQVLNAQTQQPIQNVNVIVTGGTPGPALNGFSGTNGVMNFGQLSSNIQICVTQSAVAMGGCLPYTITQPQTLTLLVSANAPPQIGQVQPIIVSTTISSNGQTTTTQLAQTTSSNGGYSIPNFPAGYVALLAVVVAALFLFVRKGKKS